MPEYNFTKIVAKSYAFDDYLVHHNFTIPITVSTNDDQLIISTEHELTVSELELLTVLVNGYTDPAIFLQLSHTENLSGVSQSTSSSTLTDVQALIFPSNINTDNGTKIDAVKTILKVTADLAQIADLNEATATIQIHDYTRDVLISTITVNLGEILAEWKASEETGSVLAYKSVMFSGLINKCTNYDLIWSFRLSVSDSRLNVSLNGLQKLFYNPL